MQDIANSGFVVCQVIVCGAFKYIPLAKLGGKRGCVVWTKGSVDFSMFSIANVGYSLRNVRKSLGCEYVSLSLETLAIALVTLAQIVTQVVLRRVVLPFMCGVSFPQFCSAASMSSTVIGQS